jgi:hypothetical protein
LDINGVAIGVVRHVRNYRNGSKLLALADKFTRATECAPVCTFASLQLKFESKELVSRLHGVPTSADPWIGRTLSEMERPHTEGEPNALSAP